MPKTSHSLTAIVHARVDDSRKNRVDHIFDQLGLTPSDALNLFYAQVDQRRGLPFEVMLTRVPNAATLASLKEDVSQYPAYRLATEVMQTSRRSQRN